MQVVCIACKVPQAFTDDYKAKLNTDYTQTQNELQVLCMKGGKKNNHHQARKKHTQERKDEGLQRVKCGHHTLVFCY